MNAKGNSIQKVIRNRNFSLLWAGQGVSLLGDQFEMIAAPWLVLNLTNDPLALGTVLALSSIPRAAFMLLGGAISDRFSSRMVMLVSDVIRLALTVVMALLVFTGGIQIWQLYAFALLFGLVGGFFNPAANSMVPHIVENDDLQAGNALIQGTAQLTSFVGPVLAGGLIALFANGQSGPSSAGMAGIAAAFALDAVTFLVSILTLVAMTPVQAPEKSAGENVLAAIKSGIRFALGDNLLRVMFVLIAAANLLFVGPLLVGMPVLAQLRLVGGAAAFGLVMSAYGGGNLAGILLAGSLPKPKAEQLNRLVVALVASFGAALISFAFITSTGLAFAVLLAVGVGNGYFAITAITLLQQRTPPHMVGRVMSLILFANVGLVPVSQALSGLFIKLSLEGLFIGAGLLMIVLAAWTALDREARQMGQYMLEPNSNI
jgi:MFS family permease